MISQSGETADTLEALRLINDMGLFTLALTNEPSSTMVREADGFLLTQAGHERAAASTKSFSTQLVVLYWFAHCLAQAKGIRKVKWQAVEEELLVAAEVLENSIENYKLEIEQKLAKQYARYQNIIFLGRHISYPFAMESALKLKKISYIFAECCPAGELKHGLLTLVDVNRPLFLFSHQDPLIYQKILTNAQEIKARGGHILAFLFEGQKELELLADYSFIIPAVNPLLAPIAMAGLMQFFIYHIAKELNCPIDEPRNISKTVIRE
jgi:glucosamine--fructose-6-phosphate aminotransferase (isomerizing)